MSVFFPIPVSVQATSVLNDTRLNSLRAYIDMLIPEDQLPGALSLNAETVILQKAEKDHDYATAISRGVLWLNIWAKKLGAMNFYELPEANRLKIVALSEQSRLATLPNLFYLTVRQDVFQYYYAHPEILKHFYYARPPQPDGFPDFSEPPHA